MMEAGQYCEMWKHIVVDPCEPQVIFPVEGVNQFADHPAVFHECVTPVHFAGSASLTNSQDIGHKRQFYFVFYVWLNDRL